MILTLEQIESVRPATMMDLVDQSVYGDCMERWNWQWAPLNHSYYYAICRLLQPRTILEIGVLDGLSMIAMLLGSPGAHCTGWDIEGYTKGSMQTARRNLNLCGITGERFDLQIRNSRDERMLHIGQYDLIHIDGDHSYEGCIHDLNLTVGSSSNVLLDDYIDHAGVTRAVDEFVNWHNKTLAGFLKLPTKTGVVLIQAKP